MSEWIKELKGNAKTEWEDELKKGDLLNHSKPYIIFESEVPREVEIQGIVTIDQLQDLVNHMRECQGEKIGEWISVEERLPEVGVYVWGYGKKSSLYGLNYEQVRLNKDGCWCAVYNYTHLSVTHWKPLPSPPEEL